jgi:hypothetical protein
VPLVRSSRVKTNRVVRFFAPYIVLDDRYEWPFARPVLRAWLNKAFRVVEDEVRQTPPRQGLANSTNAGGSRKTVCDLMLKKGNL